VVFYAAQRFCIGVKKQNALVKTQPGFWPVLALHAVSVMLTWFYALDIDMPDKSCSMTNSNAGLADFEIEKAEINSFGML
jgi:hypothetical protein